MQKPPDLKVASDWNPPNSWLSITTIDAHTEGEPLRVIVSGYPELEGETVLERRRDALERHDDLRTALMWEPRGHADMYGCLIMPPTEPGSDFSVLFLHNEGYSSMCGHGILGVTKVVLETGILKAIGPTTTLRIDTPAGTVTAHAQIDGELVEEVWFDNVPSFVVALDQLVEVEGIGEVKYDLAFGGAYYAYVDAETVDLTLDAEHADELIDVGMAIKRAVQSDVTITHPVEPDLGFLYGTIFVGRPANPNHHSRNVCIFAEGEVDRSPTGTGVSGRLAIHHARGELDLRDSVVIESILGTRFVATILRHEIFEGIRAIVPRVNGRVFITGRHKFLLSPDDPLRDGFLIRS
jgi:trans-L-3-hydroxyproline dehydratase